MTRLTTPPPMSFPTGAALTTARRRIPALTIASVIVAMPLEYAVVELGMHLRELADEFGLHDGVHPHLAATFPGTRTQRATTRRPRDP